MNSLLITTIFSLSIFASSVFASSHSCELYFNYFDEKATEVADSMHAKLPAVSSPTTETISQLSACWNKYLDNAKHTGIRAQSAKRMIQASYFSVESPALLAIRTSKLNAEIQRWRQATLDLARSNPTEFFSRQEELSAHSKQLEDELRRCDELNALEGECFSIHLRAMLERLFFAKSAAETGYLANSDKTLRNLVDILSTIPTPQPSPFGSRYSVIFRKWVNTINHFKIPRFWGFESRFNEVAKEKGVSCTDNKSEPCFATPTMLDGRQEL